MLLSVECGSAFAVAMKCPAGLALIVDIRFTAIKRVVKLVCTPVLSPVPCLLHSPRTLSDSRVSHYYEFLAVPRRVSEWLAATLEMWCRATGCEFESRALRSWTLHFDRDGKLSLLALLPR